MKYVKNKINESKGKKKKTRYIKENLVKLAAECIFHILFFFFLGNIYSLYLRGLGLEEASYLSVLWYF